MAIIKTDAFLVRRVDFRNSSYIIDLFTQTAGRISCIAKGARKQKSRFFGRLDYGSLLETVFIEKRGSLSILTEVDVKHYFTALRWDRRKLTIGLLFLRIMREFLEDHLIEKGIFSLCLSFFRILNEFRAREGLPLYLSALLELLEAAGFRPELNTCLYCGKTEKRNIFFSFEKKGIVCGSCYSEKKEKKYLELSLNSVNIIRLLQESELKDILKVKYSWKDLSCVERFELEFASRVLKKDITFLRMENYHAV